MTGPTERPEAQPADPAREGIYRAIQWLLFFDVVLGLGLAVFGQVALEAHSIVLAGLGLAAVGLVLMVFFRVLAAGEARRRRRAADAADTRARLDRLAGRAGDRPE